MSRTVASLTNTSLPRVTRPVRMTPVAGAVAGDDASLQMTVPSPMVSRSVQTGTCRENIATPRPTFAPSALR